MSTVVYEEGTRQVASVDRRQQMPAAEKKVLERFLNAHDGFRAIRPTMPMQFLVSFLVVALDEGKGVQEYADVVGASQSTMSRQLLDIGDKDRDGGPGLGLVTTRQDPLNLRRHQVILTDKGRMLAYAIVRALKGGD